VKVSFLLSKNSEQQLAIGLHAAFIVRRFLLAGSGAMKE